MQQNINSGGRVFRANVKIAYAVILILAGFACFPSDPRWYGFYLIAYMAWLSAAALIFRALNDIVELHRDERTKREMLARGKQAHNARTASSDDLRNAGVKR